MCYSSSEQELNRKHEENHPFGLLFVTKQNLDKSVNQFTIAGFWTPFWGHFQRNVSQLILLRFCSFLGYFGSSRSCLQKSLK